MSFVPAKRPIVAFPISVSLYDENGKPCDIAFVAQYRRAPRQELIDLNDGAVNQGLKNLGREPAERQNGSSAPEWPYATDEDFIKDRMIGWSDVENKAGQAIAFSAQSLSEILTDYPELIVPLFRGFFSAHEGAREKN